MTPFKTDGKLVNMNGLAKPPQKFVSLAVVVTLTVGLAIAIWLGYGPFLLHMLLFLAKGAAIAALLEALIP